MDLVRQDIFDKMSGFQEKFEAQNHNFSNGFQESQEKFFKQVFVLSFFKNYSLNFRKPSLWTNFFEFLGKCPSNLTGHTCAPSLQKDLRQCYVKCSICIFSSQTKSDLFSIFLTLRIVENRGVDSQICRKFSEELKKNIPNT